MELSEMAQNQVPSGGLASLGHRTLHRGYNGAHEELLQVQFHESPTTVDHPTLKA